MWSRRCTVLIALWGCGPTGAAETGAAGPSQPSMTPTPEKKAAPPRDPQLVRSDVVREVVATLDRRKREIGTACWNDVVAPDRPARVPLMLNFSFSATGQMTASGVAESREGQDSAVTRCVQQQVASLTVSPPGMIVMQIEVPFVLP